MVVSPKIVVVIPTVRPEQYKSFLGAWEQLFKKHEVTLVTVWDGEVPGVQVYDYSSESYPTLDYQQTLYATHKNLIYRYTDACRNLGFIVAAHLNPDYVLTLDDDVSPGLSTLPIETSRDFINVQAILDLSDYDPIQAHLDVLQKRVSLGWMSTAHDTDLVPRGVPYNIRDEAPVMLSHGVWVGTPDFDGETQLILESLHDGYKPVGIPYSLPYYVGPIPRGVLFPLCGMNVMVRKEALPYLYFAPMGVDTKILDVPECGECGCKDIKEIDYSSPNKKICPNCDNSSSHTLRRPLLNRFADIWMGISLKREFDRLGWACYTGGSTILHTRASDAKKNYEQEKLGREWNEWLGTNNPDTVTRQYLDYMFTYAQKREQFATLINNIFLKNN